MLLTNFYDYSGHLNWHKVKTGPEAIPEIQRVIAMSTESLPITTVPPDGDLSGLPRDSTQPEAEFLGAGTDWLIRIGPASDQFHRVVSPCHVTVSCHASRRMHSPNVIRVAGQICGVLSDAQCHSRLCAVHVAV